MPPRLHASIARHIKRLRACRNCPDMVPPPVPGRPVLSPVLLVGQAPGVKEPLLGRPFAWTAGKTLFSWFTAHAGMDEETFRSSVYMAAVCRCFPGKTAAGGDRVPSAAEADTCAAWLKAEFRLLRPQLVIPVGKLAIGRFLPQTGKLTEIIGRRFRIRYAGVDCDLIPLPHPSGASPWHRMEPGLSLVRRALQMIVTHPAFASLCRPADPPAGVSSRARRTDVPRQP